MSRNLSYEPLGRESADELMSAVGCVPAPADFWAFMLADYATARPGGLDPNLFERVWIPVGWAEDWKNGLYTQGAPLSTASSPKLLD